MRYVIAVTSQKNNYGAFGYLCRAKVLGSDRTWNLSDKELQERFLAGDKKLLGRFLIECCGKNFVALSNRYYSLKLEPGDVLSIACKHLLEYNMSVLRSYKEGYFDDKSHQNYECEEEKNAEGLRRYIIKMTNRCLGKMLSKELTTVGTGKDKGWKKSPPGQEVSVPERIPQITAGYSLNLDNSELSDIEKNVKELLTAFNYNAVDFNSLIARLPMPEQKIYVYCSIQGLSAQSVGKKLGLSTVEVYEKHAAAKELLKYMKK